MSPKNILYRIRVCIYMRLCIYTIKTYTVVHTIKYSPPIHYQRASMPHGVATAGGTIFFNSSQATIQDTCAARAFTYEYICEPQTYKKFNSRAYIAVNTEYTRLCFARIAAAHTRGIYLSQPVVPMTAFSTNQIAALMTTFLFLDT